MSGPGRILLAIAGLALAVSCSRPVPRLELITPVLGVDRSIAEQLADRLNADGIVHIELIPPPDGGRSTLEALAGGYGDLAFASNDQQWREGVATLLPLYPTVLHVIAVAGPAASSHPDLLRGATVYAGPEGSASRRLVERVIESYRIDPATVTFVDATGERPDLVVVYAPIDRERLLREADGIGARLLSFGDPDTIGRGSEVDRAVLFNPRLKPFIIPVGTYDELTPEPVVTVAVEKLLVARSDLPDTSAYDVVREVLRHRPVLAGDRPELFQRLDEDFETSSFAFAMHPGALDWLERDAPSFVERYSGVAEVLVTLLIGLVSGSYAVLRIYRIRRKNRIDRYYAEVMAVRDSVAEDAPDAERRAAVERIRGLQNEAFEQLMQEKLAADESFRIFITLSDDAIRTLRTGT